MSSAPNLEDMHVLANSVRRVYNRLKHSTDVLHKATGVSAPKRTLLMDLHRCGPQTVPALAAARFISRQIIQTQVNDLAQLGYVLATPNPGHKRSSLISLTASGRKLVDQMIVRENALIAELGWLPEAGELATCVKVLDAIHSHLEVADTERGR
jgi:DNA-binding MarR family transcriptional regulator